MYKQKYILNHHNLYKGVYTDVYMETKKQQKTLTLTNEEIKVNLKKLQQDVQNAYGVIKTLLPEAIENKEIKPFGNASHITLPKEYAGKKATIIIKK